jgi:hypothetical protein
MYQQIYLYPGIIQILRLKSPFGGLGVGNLINARIPILPILYLTNVSLYNIDYLNYMSGYIKFRVTGIKELINT